MKIASKILLTVLLLFSFSFPLADRAYAMAQISLQNNSKFWLYLYIDGNFGCGPVMPSGFCTSSVKEGSHRLEARKGGDPSTTIMYEPSVNIGDGTSPTWTVNYEEPVTVEGVWEIISANQYASQKDIGNAIIISRKGDGYEVKASDGSSTTYSGNERRITYTSLDGLAGGSPEGGGPPIPPSVLKQKIPVNYSYTLSGDGRFLQEEFDFIRLYWEKNSGRFHHYEIEPGKCKLTLKRVSGPASKPTQ